MPLENWLPLIGRIAYGNSPKPNPDYVPSSQEAQVLAEYNGTPVDPNSVQAQGTPYRQPGFWENVLSPGVAQQEDDRNNQAFEAQRQQAIKEAIGSKIFAQTAKQLHPDFNGTNAQGYYMFGGGGESPMQASPQNVALGGIASGINPLQTKANLNQASSDVLNTGQNLNRASIGAKSNIGSLLGMNDVQDVLYGGDLTKSKQALLPSETGFGLASNKAGMQEAFNRLDAASALSPYIGQEAKIGAIRSLTEAMRPGLASWIDENGVAHKGIPADAFGGASVAGPDGKVYKTKDTLNVLPPDKVDPSTLAHDTPKVKSLVQQAKDLQNANKTNTPEYHDVLNKLDELHKQLDTEYQKGKANTGFIPSLGRVLTLRPEDYPEGTIYHDWPISIRDKEKALLGGTGDWLKRKLWSGD